MRRVKALVTSITLLFGVLPPSTAQAQAVRNVISSCHVETTAGIIEKGRCKIKTWVEGEYIIVEIKKSWEGYKNPRYFRLTNDANCKYWSYFKHDDDDNCLVRAIDSDEWDGIVGIGESEDEEGTKQFGYYYGRAYMFTYHGSLPRPSSPDIKTTSTDKGNCKAAIIDANRRIMKGRNISVKTDIREVSDTYTDYPSGRKYALWFLLNGTSSESILQSAQFQKYFASQIIKNCDDVSLVLFGTGGSDYYWKIGLMPNGAIDFFECIDDKVEETPGIRPKWGQQYC